jgi:hypothetical protein
MISKVSWDNLWTFFFGLSQFHGHYSWLVCEVVLSYSCSRLYEMVKTFPRNIRMSSSFIYKVEEANSLSFLSWTPIFGS